MFPQQGVIDLTSRQINDFLQKGKQKKIELVFRPAASEHVEEEEHQLLQQQADDHTVHSCRVDLLGNLRPLVRVEQVVPVEINYENTFFGSIGFVLAGPLCSVLEKSHIGNYRDFGVRARFGILVQCSTI